jgi:methionyl-tRNA formyltransferase
MRVVFMGSAEIACPSMTALLASSTLEVVGCVTQPDRPSGRSLKDTPCPACAYARARGLEPYTPDDVNQPQSLAWLRGLRPDVVVVIAYGQILSPAVLAVPPRGCINLHSSLLPRYRGAAPIQWAIANGESVTGVTAMCMDAGMDTGDILAAREVPIGPDDTASDLHDKLAVVGVALLMETLAQVADGTVTRTPQAHAEATYAPKLRKADGSIDWRASARSICDRVRGFNPWPCCYCNVPMHEREDGKREGSERVRVLRARVCEGKGEPGVVLVGGDEAPVIACGAGAVELVDVQPEGRRRMSGAAYARGRTLRVGDRLSH